MNGNILLNQLASLHARADYEVNNCDADCVARHEGEREAYYTAMKLVSMGFRLGDCAVDVACRQARTALRTITFRVTNPDGQEVGAIDANSAFDAAEKMGVTVEHSAPGWAFLSNRHQLTWRVSK